MGGMSDREVAGLPRLQPAAAPHAGPARLLVVTSLLLAAVSVTLSVLGPWLLGNATNLIFSGMISKQIPAGVSKAQIIARLRHEGNGTQADMLSAMHLVPGHGIDFSHVGQVLLLVLLVYLGSSAGMLMQGRVTATVVQRMVFRLREQVQAKLSRLPLSYFDRQPRGEILSRVTNDIDNLAQSLQQTLSQLVISLLTIVGVLAVMFVISSLLALIALVTVPVSVFVVARIGKRAQPQFIKQWSHDRQAERPHRGDVHRSLAGQGVRPAGRGDARPSPSRTSRCTRPATGRSSSPAPSSRR